MVEQRQNRPSFHQHFNERNLFIFSHILMQQHQLNYR
jgi:hypothetical protein